MELINELNEEGREKTNYLQRSRELLKNRLVLFEERLVRLERDVFDCGQPVSLGNKPVVVLTKFVWPDLPSSKFE